MTDDEKKSIPGRLVDFEEITIADENPRPTIEIAQQPEFYKIPKRFGTVPVDELPLGYVKAKGYSDKFPFIKLPFQKMEEIKFGNNKDFTNKIFWGDNLHIMRMLPSESIDLIYIDPPFFSGRNYNVIFGDENEVRSFSDIWEGGMPTYLIWLNARLLEMKRLLKSTGSIYVHLDWHASHYVKVEMDKIFGYNNFINEIAWCYTGPRKSKNAFARKHDTILLYARGKNYIFNEQRVEHKSGVHNKGQVFGSFKEPDLQVKEELESKGKLLEDWWSDIWSTDRYRNELIGYPTQKPISLLKRIINASTNEGDVIADFFAGGGTTAVAAQELNRRWIVSDVSRIAVEITKGRIFKVIKESVNALNSPNIEVLSWGYYDISSLSKLTDEDFRSFILDAFGARKVSDVFIAGLKRGIPVWVGPKDHELLVDETPVLEFAEYLEKYYENRKKGIMIAWQFSDRAKQTQEMLAKLGAGIDFVSIDLVPIGSSNFKKHIVEKNEEYAGFLRFILPPVARIRVKRVSNGTYEFDFSESVSLNNGKIVNIQADFNFDGIFIPTTGFAITGGRNKEKGLILTQEFQESGIIRAAFKIEDDQGGEALIIKEIEVS
jgi:DNA modification methylase